MQAQREAGAGRGQGKRLLIAAELEEGMRLNTSNVKQLCSTDEVYAEKKYKDPFSYVPTHTLVLYTNIFRGLVQLTVVRGGGLS